MRAILKKNLTITCRTPNHADYKYLLVIKKGAPVTVFQVHGDTADIGFYTPKGYARRTVATQILKGI